MPPPLPVVLLPLRVLLVTVSVPLFWIPPPNGAELPEIVLFLIVSVPPVLFRMPPPPGPLVVVQPLVIVRLSRVAVTPPLIENTRTSPVLSLLVSPLMVICAASAEPSIVMSLRTGSMWSRGGSSRRKAPRRRYGIARSRVCDRIAQGTCAAIVGVGDGQRGRIRGRDANGAAQQRCQ